MVLPCASVMVIIVLLNDAFTCATPDAMFLRSRRRTRVASLPILGPFGTRRPEPGPYDPVFDYPGLTSSCRQSALPDPCGCGHWCGCAGRAPEDRVDGVSLGSSRGP